MKKKKNVVPRSIKRMFPNVNVIQDAKRRVNIVVKKCDIKLSGKGNPQACAMAEAIKREFHATAVIGKGSSYIIKGNKATRFKTPESVSREIVSFDRHGDFEVGEYYLRPYSPALKLGSNHRSKDKRARHDTAPKKIHHTARIREFNA